MGQAEGEAHEALRGLGDPPRGPRYRRVTRGRPHLTGPQAIGTRCPLRTFEDNPSSRGRAEASCSAFRKGAQPFRSGHKDMSWGHQDPTSPSGYRRRNRLLLPARAESEGLGYPPPRGEQEAGRDWGGNNPPRLLWCREGTQQLRGPHRADTELGFPGSQGLQSLRSTGEERVLEIRRA